MDFEDAPIVKPAKQSMLPWILFALTLVAAVGGMLVEEQKLDAASARVASAAKSEEKARAELTDTGNAKRALETRVSELQTENGRLTAKVAAAARVDAATTTTTHARASKKSRKHHKRA